jgi:hypothetical protein
MMRRRVAWLALAMALAGCSDGGRLMNIGSGASAPDEFAILPARPLVIPEDLAGLPEPVPGGTNLAAVDALGAGVRALGGDPAGGQSDQALRALAARIAAPDIRATLAAEDAAFRAANGPRLLERLAGTNVYFRVYAPQSLEARAEAARWRSAGVATPSAPPSSP